MFTRLQKILPDAIQKHSMKRVITATQVCHEFRKLIPKFFSKQAEDYINAKYFKDGTLTIGVPSGGWAKAVLMRKTDIIRELNGQIGQKIIQKLRTQIEENQFSEGH